MGREPCSKCVVRRRQCLSFRAKVCQHLTFWYTHDGRFGDALGSPPSFSCGHTVWPREPGDAGCSNGNGSDTRSELPVPQCHLWQTIQRCISTSVSVMGRLQHTACTLYNLSGEGIRHRETARVCAWQGELRDAFSDPGVVKAKRA